MWLWARTRHIGCSCEACIDLDKQPLIRFERCEFGPKVSALFIPSHSRGCHILDNTHNPQFQEVDSTCLRCRENLFREEYRIFLAKGLGMEQIAREYDYAEGWIERTIEYRLMLDRHVKFMMDAFLHQPDPYAKISRPSSINGYQPTILKVKLET